MNPEELIDQGLKIPNIKRDLRTSIVSLVNAGFCPEFWIDRERRDEFLNNPDLSDVDLDYDAIEKIKKIMLSKDGTNIERLAALQFKDFTQLKHWENSIMSAYDKSRVISRAVSLTKQYVEEFQKTKRDKEALSGKMAEVINDIQEKIKIKRGKRGFLNRLEMKLRTRLLPDTRWAGVNRPSLRLYFQLDNLWINIMDKDNSANGFKVPYGHVDKDGKADKITISITISFRKIANYLIRLSREAGVARMLGANTEYILSRSGCCSSNGIAYGKHPQHTWARTLFPYLSGQGQSSSVCFGSLDSSLWNLLYSLDIKGFSMMLKTWATNFTFGLTHPYHSISTLYRGVPKEFGELGLRIGNDVHACETKWANGYRWTEEENRRKGILSFPIDAKNEADHCDKIECQLRSTNKNTSQSNPCRVYSAWNRIRENTKKNIKVIERK